MGDCTMKIARDKALSKDLRELKKLLKLVPDDRRTIAEKLINEIVFITKTLAELRKSVEVDGAIDLFKQGKQQFKRENPALKAYNVMVQRYSLLNRQLTDLLPKPQLTDRNKQELIEFLRNNL